MSKKTSKNTLAVIEHAEVSNNINLNINQNDLVDLVLAEKMTIIEAELASVRADHQAIQDKCNTTLKKYAKEAYKQLAKADKDIKGISEVMHTLGIENIEEALQLKLTNDSYNTEVIGNFYKIDRDVEEYTNTRTFNSCSNLREFKSYNLEMLEIKLRHPHKGVELVANYTINLPKAFKQKVEKALKADNILWFEILKKKYEIEKAYVEAKFGEKKVRSAIIKQTLSKSEEGRAILAMLETTNKVKLLK